MSKPKKEAAPAPAGEDGEAPAKKKPPIMLIAMIAGGLVVVGGGGAAALMLMGGKGAHAEAGHEKPKPKKKAEGHGEKGKGKEGKSPISEGPDGVVYYTMPDITSNMQGVDGKPGYIKLKLAFELPDADAAEALEPNAPRLNDMLQTFLRELRPEDLSGSAGSYQLRMEILRRVNLVIAPSKVNAVLIEEMLVN